MVKIKFWRLGVHFYFEYNNGYYHIMDKRYSMKTEDQGTIEGYVFELSKKVVIIRAKDDEEYRLALTGKLKELPVACRLMVLK